MPEIWVPTEGLPYISSVEAQWLAVDALLVSRARGFEFMPTYLGYLSHYIIRWLDREDIKEYKDSINGHYRIVLQTEQYRRVLDIPENNKYLIIMEETFPVGLVLESVLKGRTKSNSVDIAERKLRAIGGQIRDEFKKEGIELPRFTRFSGERKLELLWTKYSDLLHYVGAHLVGLRCATENEGIPNIDVADTYLSRLQSQLKSPNRAKRRGPKIKFPDPTKLVFATPEQYETRKK